MQKFYTEQDIVTNAAIDKFPSGAYLDPKLAYTQTGMNVNKTQPKTQNNLRQLKTTLVGVVLLSPHHHHLRCNSTLSKSGS